MSASMIAACVIVFGSCGVALVWGRRPERLAATATVLSSALVVLLQDPARRGDVGIALIMCDAVHAMLMIIIALVTHRRWLVPGSGVLVLLVGAHIAILVDPTLQALPYRAALNTWAYLWSLCMILGVILEAIPERRRLQAANHPLNA